MIAAGWKTPGKQSCIKFREMKLGSLEAQDNSQIVVQLSRFRFRPILET